MSVGPLKRAQSNTVGLQWFCLMCPSFPATGRLGCLASRIMLCLFQRLQLQCVVAVVVAGGVVVEAAAAAPTTAAAGGGVVVFVVVVVLLHYYYNNKYYCYYY